MFLCKLAPHPISLPQSPPHTTPYLQAWGLAVNLPLVVSYQSLGTSFSLLCCPAPVCSLRTAAHLHLLVHTKAPLFLAPLKSHAFTLNQSFKTKPPPSLAPDDPVYVCGASSKQLQK